ncbi:MAG TPA: M81 family metallopeptidase, partial [Chloroflexota bacterium]|nr:M81 family metallopeptidase [Chloroflexota bacterium]
MKVLIASIMHEGNTFAPTRTTLDHFEQAGLYVGPTIVDAFTGTNTELGGFLEVADQTGIELVPLLAASAVPSGILARGTFESLRDQLLAGIRASSEFDGVLLALHGALAADGFEDGDGELLASVRAAVGPEVPIVATLDLHANLTARMVGSADALIGYDRLPHTDAAEKGAKAATLLINMIRGEVRPVMAWRKIPMLTTPENAHTLFGPLADLVAT